MLIIKGQIKHETNIMKSENHEMKEKGVKMGHEGFGHAWLESSVSLASRPSHLAPFGTVDRAG
jgi:hypothetical protein